MKVRTKEELRVIVKIMNEKKVGTFEAVKILDNHPEMLDLSKGVCYNSTNGSHLKQKNKTFQPAV